MAYIADVTKPQERGKYFGIVGAVVGFGFILGPSIGGLAAKISLSAPLYLAAALTILNMIYGYFVLPESLSKEKRATDFSIHHLNPFNQISFILKNNILKRLMFIAFFYYITLSSLSGISSVFLKDVLNWNAGNIGIYFLVLGAFDMFTQGYLSGKLLPILGVIKTAVIGFIVAAVAFLLYATLPFISIALFAFVFIIVYSLGSGLFEPAFAGLVSGVATPQEQGRVQGANQSVQSLTRILGPLIAAFLYGFSKSLPWLFCFFLAIIGIYLLIQNRHTITTHLKSFE
jgi:DHA1 family tetracycline resistance protein-like MFS transporter